MNKIFNCSLKIGKGNDDASIVICNVKYHSETIMTSQIEKYESILEKVFHLVVKELSQKPLYGGYQIKGEQIDVSLDSIEKDLCESKLVLGPDSFKNEDVKIELSEKAKEWCYPKIISDAMTRYFFLYCTEVISIEMTRQGFNVTNSKTDKHFQEFKSLLQDVVHEHEKMIDNITRLSISTNDLKEDYNALEKQVTTLVDKYLS